MADYTVNDRFEYIYSPKIQEEVEKIRNKYIPKEENKMEKLIELDKRVERHGQIVSIIIGIIGILMLGTGLCCTILWGERLRIFIIGIIVGVIGMVIVGSAYPLYQMITEKQRIKFAEKIIALSNELISEN